MRASDLLVHPKGMVHFIPRTLDKQTKDTSAVCGHQEPVIALTGKGSR